MATKHETQVTREQFEELEARIQAFEGRLDEVESSYVGIDVVDTAYNTLNTRMGKLEERNDALASTIVSIDKSMKVLAKATQEAQPAPAAKPEPVKAKAEKPAKLNKKAKAEVREAASAPNSAKAVCKSCEGAWVANPAKVDTWVAKHEAKGCNVVRLSS